MTTVHPLASTSESSLPPSFTAPTTFRGLVKERAACLEHLRYIKAGQKEPEDLHHRVDASILATTKAKAQQTEFRMTFNAFYNFCAREDIRSIPSILAVALYLTRGDVQYGLRISKATAKHVVCRLDQLRIHVYSSSAPASLGNSPLLKNILSEGWTYVIPPRLENPSTELAASIAGQGSTVMMRLGIDSVKSLKAKKTEALSALREEGIDDDFFTWCKDRLEIACSPGSVHHARIEVTLPRYVRYFAALNVPSFPVDELRVALFILAVCEGEIVTGKGRTDVMKTTRSDAAVLAFIADLCRAMAYPPRNYIVVSEPLVKSIRDDYAHNQQAVQDDLKTSVDTKASPAISMPSVEVVRMMQDEKSTVAIDLAIKTVDEMREKRAQIVNELREERIDDAHLDFCISRIDSLCILFPPLKRVYEGYLTYWGQLNVAPLPIDELRTAVYLLSDCMDSCLPGEQVSHYTIRNRGILLLRAVRACSQVSFDTGKTLTLSDSALLAAVVKESAACDEKRASTRPRLRKKASTTASLSLPQSPAIIQETSAPPTPGSDFTSEAEVAAMLIDNPSSRNDTPPTSVKRQASSEIDVPEPKRSRRDDEIRLASLRLLDAFKPLGIYHSPKQARKIVDDFLDYFSPSL